MPEPPNKERFRKAYESNYAPILGYVLRRTVSSEDAADIVADVFATAWRKLPDMPPGDDARLWLYGIARRLLANHRRKEVHRSKVVALLAAECEEMSWRDPLPVTDRSLAQAWSALRLQDRDLLGLVVWESLSNDEIARVLRCPAKVVKVRLHRARRRFAKELERRGVDVQPAGPARQVQGGRASVRPDIEEA